ncbi:MAG: beta-ketoacyl-ACP synthase III [Bacteroidota bacterium]
MPRAAITAVGHFLPEERLTNADLERLVDTNDEWIRTRTGITERRILRDKDKATSYMATRACREALDKAGVAAEDVDLIIVATVTPDMLFPATACLVQRDLGATKAWGYDILAACSGFLFALSTGARFIEAGKHERVLVVGADKMSSILDWSDRTTCILFGDAAGAVLLEATDDAVDDKPVGVLESVEYVDGSGAEYLRMDGGGSLHPPTHETVEKKMHSIRQDGRSVFKRAVEGMADAAVELMEKAGLTSDDVRYLVPHQANLRIIDATARRMGIPSSQAMINIGNYGNTTAATIPLCLYDWEDQLNRGDNLVLAAFGGGFTWGAAHVRWAYDGRAKSEAEG